MIIFKIKLFLKINYTWHTSKNIYERFQDIFMIEKVIKKFKFKWEHTPKISRIIKPFVKYFMLP